MTNLKKICTAVITLLVVLSFMPALAGADSTAIVYDHEVELLEKLGIVSDSLTEDMSKKVTRGEFSEMLTAIIGVGGGDNAMEELYNLGIVHGYGNGKLQEENTITLYEAVKMVINTLGYETLAEMEGGYPLGYVKIAYDVDLLRGSVQNTEMTVADAIRLLVDAGNAPMMKISNETLLGGVEMGGKTMFYTYFDVVRTEGIMTADGFTTIGSSSCIQGQVIIDGMYYEDEAGAASDLLGYYIEAYAYDDDMLDAIIVAGKMEDYNSEVSVAADSYIETVGNDLAKFTVMYEDENNAVKKITVGDNYFAIYNGKVFGGLTLTGHGAGLYNLNDGLADVTFVDNDCDGIYEFIKINEYETYIIESTNESTYDVYGKYLKNLNLDPNKYDVVIYKAGGAEARISDLTKGTAVSVLKSADGELRKVYILSGTANGTINGISTVDGHTAVTLGTKRLIITKEFENLSHPDKITAVIGGNFKMVLDRNGNIVDIQMIEDVWAYGFVLTTGYDENKESVSMITLFDQSNTELRFGLGEKVVVDGKSCKTTDLVTPGICTNTGGYPKAVRQLIRYKTSNGTITNIDTAVHNAGVESEDSLQLSYSRDDSTARFSKNSGYVYVGDEVLFGGDDDTVIFTIPASSKYYDEIAYYSTQKLSTISDRNAIQKPQAFNMNDGKIAKVVVRYWDNMSRAHVSSNYVIVNRISTVVNKDGEVVHKVEGIRASNGATYSKESTLRNLDNASQGLPYLPEQVLPGISFGDCIAYSEKTIQDYGSVLWSVRKVLDAHDPVGASFFTNIGNNPSYTDEYVSSGREYLGYLTYADDSHFKIENGSQSSYFKSEGSSIYVVDGADETITQIDAAALPAYSHQNAKMVVVSKTGSVVMAVVYINFS